MPPLPQRSEETSLKGVHIHALVRHHLDRNLRSTLTRKGYFPTYGEATMSTSDRRWAALLSAALVCLPLQSKAVTQDNFLARNTQDIIELCSVAPNDPLYVPATHFCQGYLVGIFQYQDHFFRGPGLTPMVCPPNPKPSRNQTIANYVAWAKSHPQYGNESAVGSFMRFLIEGYACKK
jgi:hypothetical protein